MSIPRITGSPPIDPSVVDSPSPFDSLKGLPTDIINEIFLRLSLEDILACDLTCRHFNQMTQKNGLWSLLFNRDLSPHLARDFSQGCKRAYIDCYRLKFNIEHGIFSTLIHEDAPKIYEDAPDRSDSCLAFFEEYLIKGDWKGKMVVWNVGENKVLHTLNGDQSGLSALRVCNGSLISVNDVGVKIWDIKTGKYIGEIQEPSLVLSDCLTISDGSLFAVCNNDDDELGDIRTIRSWDLKTREHLKDFSGLSLAWMVVYEGSLIFENEDDDKIEIIEIKTGERIGEFERQETSTVISWVCLDGKLILGCSGGEIHIWDIATRAYLGAFGEKHTTGISKMVIFNGMLVSLSSNELKMWNIETKKCFLSCSLDHALDMTVSGGRLSLLYSQWVTFNFAENYDKIFAELAQVLKGDNEEAKKVALLRFSSMPINAKKRIYILLHDALGLTHLYYLFSDYPEISAIGKSIFHDLARISTTPDKKAAAIEAYLLEKKREEERMNPGEWVEPEGNLKRQKFL